jgi:hypothetical protein
MNIATLFGQSSYYDNSTYYTTTTDPAVAAAAALAMLGFVFAIAAVTYVVSSIFLSRIFKKAGVEGWKAWVPVYNSWMLLEMGGQKGYWAILAFVPFVNIVSAVFMYIAMYHIGLKLQKDGAFILLAIFLPLVWMIWLAVDKSTWQGAPVGTAGQPVKPMTPAADNTTSPTAPTPQA